MSTDPDEIISVKATTGNTTGDVVKGRTCRTLNVTRKIFIRDIERIILMSLKMTQFSIGTSVYEQIRLSYGFASESGFMYDGRGLVGRNLVPNLSHNCGHHGSFCPPSSVRGQQTVLSRSFVGL